MQRWEYLSVKLHDFGDDSGEMKRPGEYWVSEYGMLDLVQRLGSEGWEVVCNVGTTLMFKRPLEGASKKAVVGMQAAAAK